MKKLFLTSILLLAVTMISTAAVNKNVTKSFKNINKLQVKNRYGKVHVKTWKKNEVKVDIEITAAGKDDDKNKLTTDNITIDFTEIGQQLNVSTIIPDFLSLKKLTNSVFKNGKLRIDYTVSIPDNIALDIELNNGDIILPSFFGALNIKQTNGNLTTGILKGESTMDITRVQLLSDRIDHLNLISANSQISIEDSEKITCKSHSSDIALQNIKEITVQSSRDNINIKNLDNFYGVGKSSKVDIANLNKEINYDIRSGYISVFHINKLFSQIKLDSKSGDIVLSFTEGSQIDYNIIHKSVKFNNSSLFTLVNKPIDVKRTLRIRKVTRKCTYEASGQIGTKAASSKLNIRANNCEIRLQ